MEKLNDRYKIIEKLDESKYETNYKVVDLFGSDELLECHLIHDLKYSEILYSHFIHHYLKYASLNQPNLQCARRFDTVKGCGASQIEKFNYFYIVDHHSQLLIDYATLTFADKINVLQQIIKAVRYCHFRGVGCGGINCKDILIYRDFENKLQAKLKAIPTIITKHFATSKIRLTDDEDLMTEDVKSIINLIISFLSNVPIEKEQNYHDLKLQLNELLNLTKLTAVSIESMIEILQKSELMTFPFDDKACYQKINFSIGIISRDRELRQLSDEIDKRFDGRTTHVGAFVTGRAGIGKTRFLSEIIFRLSAKGRLVYTIDMSEPSKQPYRFIAELIRQLIASGRVNKQLIAKYGSDLVKILPEYSDDWSVLPSMALSPKNERLKLNNRFVQFTIEACRLLTPVIFIENIHYLNDNERTLLQMLLEVVSDVPVYIVCSAIYDVFDQENYRLYRPSNDILDINLDALNEYDIEQLVRHIFYRTKDFNYVEEALKNISSGSPRSIEILLNYFLETKIIWVDQDRQWHCKPFEYQALDYKQKLADAYMSLLASLDKPSLMLLKWISVFNEAVDVKMLKQLLNVHVANFNDLINQLIANNYLSRERQLSSEYISFIDSQLKQIIYQKISEKEKIDYHRRAADMYARLANKWQRSNYLYHLLCSEQYQQALTVATSLAKEIEKLQFVDKAISLHECALDIAFKLDNKKAAIASIKRIAAIYYYKGDVENAKLQYSKLAELSKKNGFITSYIDAEIKRIEIKLRCGCAFQFESEVNQLEKCAIDIDYYKGQFDLSYIKFMRCISAEDIVCAKRMMPLFTAISERDKSDYLAAKTYIVRGLIYDYEADFDNAFRCLQEAKKLLNATDNSYEMAIVENNLGVLTVEILGDLKRAKAHFRSALNHLKKSTIMIERNKYLNNLGEVQRFEGKLLESLNSHREALRISYNVQDVEEIILTLAHLIEIYSRLSKYDLAYKHVQELFELLNQYSEVILVGLYERLYYAISLFYLKLFNKASAKHYFSKFIQSKTDYLDHLSGFRMRIHQLNCQYYLANNRCDYKFQCSEIKEMINSATCKIEKALVREVLLDIIIDIICFDSREAVEKLLICYNQIEATNFSEILSFKQSLVEHYVNRSKELANVESHQIFHQLGDEEKLKVYIIMGNYFALKGDYYCALRQYLEAVDNIRSVYLTLDKRLSEDYVLQDELKRNLFDCINILMNKIDKSFEIPLDMNVASLLDLEPYYNLYQSDDFKKSINRRYRKKHGVVFESLNDLLDKFDSDNETNINVALKYLTQLVFADFASLIMISADQTISSVFEIDKNSNNNYSVLISNYVEADKPIILGEDKLSSMGIYDLKKAMLIPVYAKYSEDARQQQLNRRRKQIRDYEHPQAILFIASYSRLNFLTDDMIQYVEQTLPILYLIIDNYNLYRSSTIDKLTGVYLRKPFEKIFLQQMEECKRMGESFSVVMLDIDHFKVVNDEYGHRKGDHVLAQIADIIVKSVRGDDAVGRYGGEEFVVLLPTASATKAYEIAERIRKNVAAADLLEDGKSVTISTGIAVYPQMGNRQNELIEKADKALYVSKNNGRNLTTVYAREKMSEDKHFDPLAGILTGTTSRDARVMKVIVDIIALVASAKPLDQKIRFILSMIIDLLEASDASIVDFNDGLKHILYAKVNGKQKLMQFNLSNESEFALDDYEREGYFIQWDNIEDEAISSNRPKWFSHVQCPIIVNGEKNGSLIVRVPIAEKKYEFSDYNIVLQIARIIGGLFN